VCRAGEGEQQTGQRAEYDGGADAAGRQGAPPCGPGRPRCTAPERLGAWDDPAPHRCLSRE